MPETRVVFKAQKTTKLEEMGLPYLMGTDHCAWETRSQHFVVSREKETKKIQKAN